jgi:hypothetical protein
MLEASPQNRVVMLSREGSKFYHIADPLDLGNEVVCADVVVRFQIVYSCCNFDSAEFRKQRNCHGKFQTSLIA